MAFGKFTTNLSRLFRQPRNSLIDFGSEARSVGAPALADSVLSRADCCLLTLQQQGQYRTSANAGAKVSLRA